MGLPRLKRHLPAACRAPVAFAGCVAFAALTWSPASRAQERPSVDLRSFRPSVDPRAQLVLEPVTTPTAWSFNAGAWLAYANQPVRVTDRTTGVTYRPVEHQLALDLTAGVGLGARSFFGVSLPMALYQTGAAPLPGQTSTTGVAPSTAIGDVALHGKATLVANDQGGFGVGALAVVTLPTGSRASFLGEGSVTASARVLVDYDLLVAGVQASVGYKLRGEDRPLLAPTFNGTTLGGEIPWTFGIRLRPGILKKMVDVDGDHRQTWEIAVRGALPAGPVGPFGTGDPGSASLSPVLLALSDRVELGHFRDSFVLAGVDIGLNTAIGVPNVRGVVAFGWAPRNHDADHDGVPDDLDQCPEIPEDRDGFEDSDGCPDIDNDEDGVTDDEDACPRVAGEPSEDKKTNGCPGAGGAASGPSAALPSAAPEAARVDRDGDGVLDAADACPDTAGDASSVPALNGCPNPDRDGDTFENGVDACPDKAEVFNGVDDNDGCPDPGGKALVVLDVTGAAPSVKLAQSLVFVGPPDGPSVDKASLVMLRALAVELGKYPNVTLAIGARPDAGAGASKSDVAQSRALARAFAVVRELALYSHRDGVAETVAWDAVRAQPFAALGIGFLVLGAGPAK